MHNPRIAIVGAGPAGLTLARLLQLRGSDVHLFERDASPSARGQGGSLDLHSDSGQLAIREAGLWTEFQPIARPLGQRSQVFDPHGTELFDLRAEDEAEIRPEVDRGLLRDLLLRSLEPETLRWAHAVETVAPVGSRQRLHFASGDPFDADLVVGCDGAWSKIRALRSSVVPHYAGVTFIETRLHDVDSRHPDIAAFVGQGNLLAVGDNRALMAQRNGDASIRIYISLRVPENWLQTAAIPLDDPSAAKTALLHQFEGWSESLLRLIRASEDPFLPRPLFTFSPDQPPWQHSSNVTLLGDAAHLMPPFSGKGANYAMLDALELAHELDSGPSVEAAIARYEARMLARMKAAILETLHIQDRMLSPLGAAALVADIRAALAEARA